MVDEKEIFKICLEYWNHLAAGLYRENPFSSSHSPLLISQQNPPPRRQLYYPILSKVRLYSYISICTSTDECTYDADLSPQVQYLTLLSITVVH